MPALSFVVEWMDGCGIEGAELSSTMAALRIYAENSPVTRVHDEHSESVRDEIYVPVYPFAEWLATNWWFLNNEMVNPNKKKDTDFLNRHTLGIGMDGYAFPSLRIISTGARMFLTWRASESGWTNVSFLESGSTWIGNDEFRETCADLIDRTVRRLESCDIHGTLLQEDWSAIQSADADEAGFCATAAGLGWDPYAIGDAEREQVIYVADLIGSMAIEEAVAALDPRTLRKDCAAIQQIVTYAKTNGLALETIRSVRNDVMQRARQDDSDPWTKGYEMARELRRTLDPGVAPLKTTERMAQAICESPEALEKAMKPVAMDGAALIDAAIAHDRDKNPAFAFRRPHDRNRNFVFCRALAEVLESPTPSMFLTRARSERQQRGRAFAAEFLAPASALQDRISASTVAGDEIDDLADEFGVSSFVIAHQIENHRIASVSREI